MGCWPRRARRCCRRFFGKGEGTENPRVGSSILSLAAVTPDIVADYRDQRLAKGKSASTVRLELSLLSHMFTIAICEWRVGLTYNPVSTIRKPTPTKGRNRRLSKEEEGRLFAALDRYSNPMLGWVARIALHTAMRAGEIKSLTREQVNLSKRVVYLSDTKNGSEREQGLGAGASINLLLGAREFSVDYRIELFPEYVECSQALQCGFC